MMSDFAGTTAEMSDLTKKEATNKIQWTEKLESSFNKIKEALTSGPILRSPDEKKPFVLQTDASGRGIGAVLNQRDEAGVLCPVAYYSRKLLPRETRYAGTQLECLALVDAIRHFRVYLSGRPFKVQTDNRALVYLDRFRDENHRLTRWALSLQSYQFEVQHRPGRNNGNADGLSRQYEDEKTDWIHPEKKEGGMLGCSPTP